MTIHRPILLIGGGGKTGSRVARRLEALGRPFRIGSRSATRVFDWKDRDSWAAAVDGAQAAYITYYPDVTVPGGVDDIDAFVRLAVDRGCRRLVFLSGRGEEDAERAEQALIGSGAEWTVVRAAWFMQNFSESFFLDGVLAGEVAFPADGVTEPFVDAEDIADVVTMALTQQGHAGKIYDVTGPRLMTFAEAVGEIGKAAGRDIRYVPVTVEDYVAALKEADVPEHYIQLLVYLAREVLDGRNESVADGVSRALGRKPRDFCDYARDAAASGVWGA
ncbi:MAG: NmrA family transcriptional regulator [Rhizobiaceae bacterium]|nr:NmrA family transcriptional regulator [Rhizobiaceae bacterium]MCV0405694.1 NmrA family transcriptional regulator [Rhizobiaceae bacterium]